MGSNNSEELNLSTVGPPKSLYWPRVSECTNFEGLLTILLAWLCRIRPHDICNASRLPQMYARENLGSILCHPTSDPLQATALRYVYFTFRAIKGILTAGQRFYEGRSVQQKKRWSGLKPRILIVYGGHMPDLPFTDRAGSNFPILMTHTYARQRWKALQDAAREPATMQHDVVGEANVSKRAMSGYGYVP
ncbi:hypothetical protein C8R48DRAFT_760584 [Suillus tomentosus]|nr:hypothetical protein C8R48DRAFT_760584 [Suillus tomentosus]